MAVWDAPPEDKYILPNPDTVDISCWDDMYPKVPKPIIVDVKFGCK